MSAVNNRWRIYSYRLPLAKKLLVLGHNDGYREGLVLEKKTAYGSLFSEVAPLPSFHGISLESCYQELLHYIQEGVWPAHPINQFALLCLEKNQYSSHQIPCNALHSLSQRMSLSNDHYQIVKFKIARNDMSTDIQQLKNWSEQHPDKIIRLDGNRSWSMSQLFQFFEQVSHLPIQYIEDPLRDPSQYSFLQDIPIALDESLVDYPEQKNAPCVTHLIVKPTLHSQKSIENFAQTGLPLIFTSTFETSLGIWYIAQISQQYSPAETHGLATLDWFAQDLSFESITMKREHLIIKRSPPKPNRAHLQLRFST